MRKLIYSLAIAGMAFMVSCSAEKKAEDKGAELKAKIENCTNPDSLKMYIQQVQEYAAQLVEEGKDDAATAFIQEVAPIVEAKDPTASITLKALDLKAQADSAIEATKEAAKNLADSASQVVNDKVEGAKEAAAQKANEAVEGAKDKAAEAVQSGADKVKNLIGK